MTLLPPTAVGTPLPRVEGRDKVTGRARYAYEHPVDGVAYGWVVGSTVASGRVRGIDVGAALAEPGVLGVVWHGNARRLRQVRDAELMVLQCPDVSYYGQVVAVVVATSLETARAAARALQVDIDQHPHHSLLSPDDPDLFTPDRLNAGFPAETSDGDVETALAGAAFAVDEVYETPYLHNQPMEPHAAVAQWSDDGDSRHGHYDGSDRSDTAKEAKEAKEATVRRGSRSGTPPRTPASSPGPRPGCSACPTVAWWCTRSTSAAASAGRARPVHTACWPRSPPWP